MNIIHYVDLIKLLSNSRDGIAPASFVSELLSKSRMSLVYPVGILENWTALFQTSNEAIDTLLYPIHISIERYSKEKLIQSN